MSEAALQTVALLAEKSSWPAAIYQSGEFGFQNRLFTDLVISDARLTECIVEMVRTVIRTGESIERESVGALQHWSINAGLMPYQPEGEPAVLVVAIPESRLPGDRFQELHDTSRRLQLSFESSFDAMLVLRNESSDENKVVFRLVELNQAAARLIGRDRTQLLGKNLIQELSGAWGADLAAKYRRVEADGEPFTEEFAVLSGGETRWLRQRVVPTHDGVAVTLRDVTQERRVELQTREHLRVLENALDGILTADDQGKIDFINSTFADMLGRTINTAMGLCWDIVAQPEERTRLRDLLSRTIQDERVEAEVRGYRPDGMPLFLHLVMLPRFREGESFGHYVFAIDVTDQRAYEAQLELQMRLVNEARDELTARSHELEQANIRLRDLATTDGLTGLRNHRYFRERLTAESTRAKRYSLPLSILMVDVDYFKQFNDAYGHPAGDEVLRELAIIFRSKVRSTDLVARYGGEEFAVVMPQTDADAAARLGERLRAAVDAHRWTHASVTISAGGACMGPELDSPESLLQAADDALYDAKRKGRNRVSFHGDLAEEPAQ